MAAAAGPSTLAATTYPAKLPMAAPISKQTATTKHPANQVELLLREDIILPPWAEVDKKLGL
ncbi:MAG: hypothetical protein BroJett011_00030 [Chloroflexota bacterium]|nr:MAG: hypothetical protein BroJett011_00030 [Chloroflexota bacterium]